MSMIRCADCSQPLDTDENPEVFRDMDWVPLCDSCFDAHLDEALAYDMEYRGVMA